jgi:hypothetical protein
MAKGDPSWPLVDMGPDHACCSVSIPPSRWQDNPQLRPYGIGPDGLSPRTGSRAALQTLQRGDAWALGQNNPIWTHHLID